MNVCLVPVQSGCEAHLRIMPCMTLGKLLDLQAVADHTGLAKKTVQWYHNTATTRRRVGESKPGDMPEPDASFGRSPAWYEHTIDTWLVSRPGRGAGGGRPRKRTADE